MNQEKKHNADSDARALYRAYCKACPRVQPTGKMDTWGELPALHQEMWREMARQLQTPAVVAVADWPERLYWAHCAALPQIAVTPRQCTWDELRPLDRDLWRWMVANLGDTP